VYFCCAVSPFKQGRFIGDMSRVKELLMYGVEVNRSEFASICDLITLEKLDMTSTEGVDQVLSPLLPCLVKYITL
jgi:hypothetical protein